MARHDRRAADLAEFHGRSSHIDPALCRTFLALSRRASEMDAHAARRRNRARTRRGQSSRRQLRPHRHRHPRRSRGALRMPRAAEARVRVDAPRSSCCRTKRAGPPTRSRRPSCTRGVHGAIAIKDADSFFTPSPLPDTSFVSVSDVRQSPRMTNVGAKSFAVINGEGPDRRHGGKEPRLQPRFGRPLRLHRRRTLRRNLRRHRAMPIAKARSSSRM